jgi:hypothetical protein
VNTLVSQLRVEGWTILYADFVDSRRSGAGSQGVLNSCFKRIFDQFPDIAAFRNHSLLLVEVNLSYKDRYLKKLQTFHSKKDELFRCIESGLGLDVKTLQLGFSFTRIPRVRLRDYRLWIYRPRRKAFEEINEVH